MYCVTLFAGGGLKPGGHKEMSSILAEQQRPRIAQMRGEGGGGCGVTANEYSCAFRAQINFGDLSLYFTMIETDAERDVLTRLS